MNKLMKQSKLMKQIIRFAFVGGSAFVIDFGMLYLFKQVLGVDVVVANTIGFCVSVVYNYVLSTLWVFDVNEEQGKTEQLIVFMILSVIGLLINNAIVWFCNEKCGMLLLFAKVIATAVVMVYNFITRKIYLEK